ncbi:MAG: helix-turn-helix domain-containing protein [Deltaproteobacteria bacterium]|nr:helix-turn-helix domain-containing protein [Deltaproteobacteria bacterium]
MGNRLVNRFRLARMQEGKLQIEIEKQTGINHCILSQMENGWRIPTPNQLKRLMKALPKLKEVVAENG